MGKTADLTVVQKTTIDTLHKEGKTQKVIAKEAGCSQSSVSKHINREAKGRKRCGRKKCTSNRDNRTLERIVKQNPFKNVGEMHKEWTAAEVSASRTTTPLRSRKYDHITPILQSLHWLPIKFRISYKILLLAYKALNDLAPAYLTNLLSRYNPTRSLRSQNSGLLVVPRIAKSTKGGRTLSYLAPKLWNSLPDNVRGSDTLSLFKSRLKTHLFSQSFI